MRETRGEVDPIFYILLSHLKSLLHKGGLPLPGKTESLDLEGPQVGFWNKVLRSGPSSVAM